MAKNEKDDIVLEGGFATWQCKLQGAVNGTYLGTFKFKCLLTPLQKIAAGKEYRDLVGPNASLAPEEETFLAWALTQLKYRIVSAPPFWTNGELSIGGDLPDENVITAVLDAAISAEKKYKDSLTKKMKDSIKKAKAGAEAIRTSNKNEEDDGEEAD